MSSDGLRRRRADSAAREEVASSATRALQSVRHFDVYTKVEDDCVQKSTGGGIVTVITSCIVALLFWSELRDFCTTEVVDSITVDTRINQKLPITLNMSFPRLRCDEVSVDNVDTSGNNQVNVHSSIQKVILDGRGFPAPPADQSGCQSCMDGADDAHKCCNTCEELKVALAAAKTMHSAQILATAPQCKNDVGCRVHGNVLVNKVSGNIHVALGKSVVRDGKHVHEFKAEDLGGGFNTSHRIDVLRFGEQVPGQVSALEGTMKVVKQGDFMFHYYMKLVPTVYIDARGRLTYTNQYAATDSAKNVRVNSGALSGLPGVFVVYDFSPFLVRKTERVKPWSYIFTSICAIIGGVVTVGSLVEMIVNAAVASGAVVGCGGSPARV